MEKSNQLIIGFNSGTVKKIVNPVSNEMLQLLLDSGANAVELSVQDIERMAGLSNLDLKLLGKFAYVSMHLPIIDYCNDKKTREIIDKVNLFTTKTHISLLVLHPDCIRDWTIIKTLKRPVAIENMDARKSTGRNVEELKEIFDKQNMGFVLDVNHALTNDPAMKLKQELIDAFGNRLVEIHASGYSEEYIHMPLCESKQDFLLKKLPENVPIILESTMHKECSLEKIKQELAYVKKCLLKD